VWERPLGDGLSRLEQRCLGPATETLVERVAEGMQDVVWFCVSSRMVTPLSVRFYPPAMPYLILGRQTTSCQGLGKYLHVVPLSGRYLLVKIMVHERCFGIGLSAYRPIGL